MARARQHWRGATLLAVTHDIEETLDFDRVLVLEAGRLVENGPPAELLRLPGSAYRGLLEAEAGVRLEVWAGRDWRRLRIDGGRLVEEAAGER